MTIVMQLRDPFTAQLIHRKLIVAQVSRQVVDAIRTPSG